MVPDRGIREEGLLNVKLRVSNAGSSEVCKRPNISGIAGACAITEMWREVIEKAPMRRATRNTKVTVVSADDMR
jgi:hypothetical protein